MTKRALYILLTTIALAGCGGNGSAPPITTATVSDIRMWHAPERTRIVFDLNRHARFDAFALQNPPRVVLDLREVRIKASVPKRASVGQFIREIRRGERKQNTTRLVFDLAKPVRYEVRLLKPSDGYRYRIVMDLYLSDGKFTELPPRKPGDELLVLIDPGHGGEDPGALGKRTSEKVVVLQIAKKLQARINRLSGLRAELTRSGDYYIPLRRRTRIARERRADLFVSIHADAFKNPAARGASVYALSSRGASSETAKWLANKENASDLAGGARLAGRESSVAGALLDMEMSKTKMESLSFGGDVLAELMKVGRVHSRRVEQAGFVVLKSPDIPSILVETAYITNPGEEKLLMSAQHQARIADAITAGIQKYIAKNRSRYARR